jgi:hypothetical protein
MQKPQHLFGPDPDPAHRDWIPGNLVWGPARPDSRCAENASGPTHQVFSPDVLRRSRQPLGIRRGRTNFGGLSGVPSNLHPGKDPLYIV